MINTFKGLVGDNNIIDLISSYSFSHDPQSQQDPGSIFIQPPLDLYNSVADDLQNGLLLTQLNQDRTKTPGSPKKDYHLGKKVQAPKGSLLGPRTDQELLADLDDDDKDGDEDGSDSDTDSNKKRGKYRTYTDEEKAHIIKFMMKHGIQQTLEIFSGGEHKITKRKLKSWLESQNKIKGVKGRKSNDPARDRALHEWCMDFQNEHGRPPSRKEATQKALELSGDPNFQASKGWLDKFSRKYNIEFTPLKIIPPRGKKKVKTSGDVVGEPVSAASTAASGLIESLSPLKEAKVKPADLEAKKMVSPAAIAKDVKQPDGNFMRINPAFNKPMYQQPPQQMPQHQHQHQHQHQQSNPMPVQPQPQMQQQQQQQPGQQPQPNSQYQQMPNPDGSFDNGIYSAISNLDGPQGQGFGYPFNYPLDYSMPYGLNYPKMYPRKSYPAMNYPMNLPMNYPNFAENLQLLQQMMMKKENDMNIDKNQFS